MFGLTAGQLHQDERERAIAEALRRRQLLEAGGAPERAATVARASSAPRRADPRVPARAER